ncbi:MAG: UvrD-helicase domain-containing protein [Clostridia bacterium]|nr:UvrD-helicase domain-containing protein [Clostridia bacterium]
MTMNDFTPKQQQAIATRNKDLLVSAGAGSGKTTVLTRRLIERIKSGESVTDFLVVTFMKAAASDVKSKLYNALLEESALDPDNKHLYRQSLLVTDANICTISSYCLNLVKENFALLGISPHVRVIDEVESAMLLRRVTEELISNGYESEDKEFLTLADNFTGDKSDDSFAETMIKLFNTLRVTLNREETLLSCADELIKEAEIIRENGLFASSVGKEIQNRLRTFYDEFVEDANDIYSYAASVAFDDAYLAPLDKLVRAFENTRLAIEKDYVNYSETAESSFSIRLSSKGCEKADAERIGEMKKRLTERHNKVVSRYVRGDDEFNAKSFEQCAFLIRKINGFLNDIEREYDAIKRESGVLDYTDFERKALELLETQDENGIYHPTELCLKKQNSLTEILIDEYQDVNPMQDRIFRLLSGKGQRFMVGDVKQSIYRFRNAYPDIFLGYKDEFADIDDPSGKDNACIFLRENFRCSESVINYVNYLFKSVTEDTSYYREYDGEWLIHASKRPDRRIPVVIAISEKEKGNAVEARRAEAEFIAREILRLRSEECASDGSEYRFSDFAVMLGAMKGYSIEYEKAFNKYRIPYKTETSESFLENPDIRLAVSSLKAIDDPTDDISLCALMRSPICNFDSNDLYRIRLRQRDVAFWYAVNKTAKPKLKRINAKSFTFKKRIGKCSLPVKCKAFIKRLTDWRESSTGVPCCEFLKSFFVSSGLLRIASTSGNKKSLELLFDYASRFESTRNIGLSSFLDYLSELSANDREISDAARSGDEDAVSFITVHKSKGLEFNVCFLAGAQKRFRNTGKGDRITVTRGKGISFTLRDRESFTTFDPLCNINAVDKERESALGEELRKLYVALTRAKERLYITGSAEIGWEEKRYTKTSFASWLDMVLYSAVGREDKPFFDLRVIGSSDDESGFRVERAKRILQPTREMLDIVNFRYPYEKSVTSAKKISVSELREGLLEDDEYDRSLISVPYSRVSMRPNFAEEDVISAADIGTANHQFMQFCSFESIKINGIEAEAKRLLDIRMITELQFKMLDFKALNSFFESELYRRMCASKRLYREKRFSVSDVLDESGESVLVQGVVDCFFENPDGSYTVVDYKTDRVRTASELAERHRVQVSYYRRAVERMTGRKVSKCLLYSFALNCEVEV